MRKGKVHIGTSGWSYKHWKGTFYPPHIKSSDEFAYYTELFGTVELNNSFYKLPSPSTFDAWKRSTPSRFVFAVKASRFFTHAKKLILEKDGLDRFFASVNNLEQKLGPILFQLPPKWKVNVERLSHFLHILPKGYLYAFEFREHTWYNSQVYSLLRKYNCAFCIYELEYHTSPLELTADFVYMRLHGPEGKYQGSYSNKVLSGWARRIRTWSGRGNDVYIYFDNDQEGFAAFNALTLQEKVKGKSIP